MELKLDDEIELIGFSNWICNRLHRAGIHHIKDILKYNLDELMELKNIGATAKKEIQGWYQAIKDGKMVIAARDEPASLDLCEPLAKPHFCNEDGLICEDFLIDDLITNARLLNALKNSGYRRLSQIIFLEPDEVRAIPNLGIKGCQEFWAFRGSLTLEPVSFADLASYEGLTGGEQLFYRIYEEFNLGAAINLSDYYYATIQLFDDYLQECDPDYDLSRALEDPKLGKLLSSNQETAVLIQDYLCQLLRKQKYGMEKEEIVAAMPVVFQDEPFISIQLESMAAKQRISELLPNRYVCGAACLIEGSAFLSTRARDIFLARINNESYKEMAAYLDIHAETARTWGKKTFTLINEGQPHFMVDAYMDIYTTYDINPEQWLGILKDQRYLEYLNQRRYYLPGPKKERVPISSMVEDLEIPESIKKQFANHQQ